MGKSPITWSLTSDEKDVLRRRIAEAAAWAEHLGSWPLTETSFRSRDLWPEGYSDTSYSWWEPPLVQIEDWIDDVAAKRSRGIEDLSLEVPSLASALECGRILAHDVRGCAGDPIQRNDSPFIDKLDNSAWDTWLLLTGNAAGEKLVGPVWLSWVPREHVEEVRQSVETSSTDCLFWADARALGLPDDPEASGFKPADYSAVSPYLVVDGAAATIEFLKRVFGAVELRRFPASSAPGKIRHAEVRIDDTVVMLADPPPGAGPVPSHVHVYVPDVDATYRRALDAGAVSVEEPERKEDPERRGAVRDPGGTTWWIATRLA
jgi:uncharacterized glyoxalase superfamily protein PhnB